MENIEQFLMESASTRGRTLGLAALTISQFVSVSTTSQQSGISQTVHLSGAVVVHADSPMVPHPPNLNRNIQHPGGIPLGVNPLVSLIIFSNPTFLTIL